MNCNYFFDILPIKLLLENLEIETFDSKFHFFLPKLILHHVENSFFLSFLKLVQTAGRSFFRITFSFLNVACVYTNMART